MSFKENLLKKIEINRLADQVNASLVPKGDIQKVDKTAMRQLLDHGDFRRENRRDLELYLPAGSAPEQLVLVLDNGLGFYRSGVDDVALRKSPTVKEMVSLRNIVKILRDEDVLISKKADTVDKVRQKALDRLDLRFTEADIDQLRLEGTASLENGYAEGVIETLVLFAELLGFSPPPKNLTFDHHYITGKAARHGGPKGYGPLVLFNRLFNRLLLVDRQVDTGNADQLAEIRQIVETQQGADTQGPEVFVCLKARVLAAQPQTAATTA